MDPRITFTRASTATFTGQNGLLQTAAINAPRFDYNPTTLAPLGLLIEEQRTNLLTYSEIFSDAAWVKTNSSITANIVVAPDGALTGDKLVENTATASHQLTRSVSFVSGTAYSLSFYAKASERNRVNLQFPSAAFTSALNVNFDLLNGTVISTAAGATASIINVGNGWYRCQASASATITTTTNITTIRLIESGTTTSYTGDGVSGLFVWGAQLEAGAFPTSYIPTVASQVTRAADLASMTGTNFSSWYNQNEGSFYVGSDYTQVAGGNFRIDVTDGTTSNQMRLRTAPTGTTQSRFELTTGGVTQTTLSPATVNPASNQDAIAYKTNDAAAVVNAGTVTTDLTLTPAVVNQMAIGTTRLGASSLNGHIKKIVYYPRRLENGELQAITA